MKSDFKKIPRSLTSHVPLAPFTTLGVGGTARFFVSAQSVEEITEALAFARENSLPIFVLGGGSNIVIADDGFDGVVLKVAMCDIQFESTGGDTLLVAGAGTRWDDVVDSVCAKGIFGIENLAGIPGTVGGAVVQNIGAYGAELANVFEYADVIDLMTGENRRITRPIATFAYRTSFFKEQRAYVIARVALRLARSATPNISYPDIARRHTFGELLDTPSDIARAVRAIRLKKFPKNAEEGTAGSFFKNPIVSRELADSLAKRFPGLAVFPNEDGMVKISLAWILDKILSLKGFSVGGARLYEEQPLVIVARSGATAEEVDALAREVAERVFKKIGINIEREVEYIGEVEK